MKTSSIQLLVTGMMCLTAQSFSQEQRGDVLVGTLDPKTFERHAYALDPTIVKMATNVQSPLTARAFVSETSKKDCCKPIKVSEHVWKCCDGRYIITEDKGYASLFPQIAKTSDQEWAAARESKFQDVPDWKPIATALREKPPIELRETDSRFQSIPWSEALKPQR